MHVRIAARLETLALAAVASLAITTSAAAAGKVHVVDPAGGPGVFLDVTAAVAAATDGDTVLVRGSWYDTVTINGKGVTVVADGGVTGVGHFDIRNTTPSQTVTVRGFGASGVFFLSLPPIEVANCQGAVILEELAVDHAIGTPNLIDHAISIVDSNRVMVVRCQVEAATGTSGSNGSPGSPGGAGIYCQGSSVGIYDCEVWGGDGGDADLFFFITNTSTFAGPGLWVADGVVVASGSTFTGGQGGDGDETAAGLCDLPSSDGGDGITLQPSGNLTMLDCTATAGAAGVDAFGCPQVGVPGVAIDTGPNGVLTVVNETARSLEVSSPARAGQTASLAIEGVPNETAILLYSASVHGAVELGLAGLLLPGAPLAAFGVALDGNGQLSTTLAVPAALPPGIESAEVFLQVGVPGSAGTGVLGSGTAVTVLASGF